MLAKQINTIILAAGSSSRMGRPKLGLKLPDERSFLEHIAHQYYDFGCEEIIVVINSDGDRYLKENPIKISQSLNYVINQTPEAGRFRSLQCGVNVLKTTNPVFIHNVDNPYANIQTLDRLSLNLAGYDFVKPVFSGFGGHPVLIGEKLINAIKNESNSAITLRSFLQAFIQNKVDVQDSTILFNINTMDDYHQFFEKENIS